VSFLHRGPGLRLRGKRLVATLVEKHINNYRTTRAARIYLRERLKC
jgi:hypothetical protein